MLKRDAITPTARAPRPPATQLVALTFADGTMGIMHFVLIEYHADGRPRWSRKGTDAEIQAEVDRTAIPWPGKAPVRHWERVSPVDLPADRTFRDAWRHRGGGRIEHDMAHVRQIHLTHLRLQRTPLLEQQDREWHRAFGQGKHEEAARIEAVRQTLRDMPTTIAADLERARTPEEVKAIKPPLP